MGLPLDDDFEWLRFGHALSQQGSCLTRRKDGKLGVIGECADRAHGLLRLVGTGCGMNVRAEQKLRKAECQHRQPSGCAEAQGALAKRGCCFCRAKHVANSAARLSSVILRKLSVHC